MLLYLDQALEEWLLALLPFWSLKEYLEEGKCINYVVSV